MSEPLKVVFLMQESRMGGVEFNAVQLAQGLDRSRLELVFLCPEPGKLTALLEEKKLPYALYWRPPFVSTSLQRGSRAFFNPLAPPYYALTMPLLAARLARQLRRLAPALVVTKGLMGGFYGALACRLAGVRCIWDVQDIVSPERLGGVFPRLLDLWGGLADGVIAPSLAIAGQFSETRRARLALVPNGIDAERYRPGLDPAPVRREWGISPDETLIGHIARLTPWKGQGDLVEAMTRIAGRMPKARFAIVGSPVFGDDGFEASLRRRVRELGLESRVIFPGFRDDLEAVLAALDVFVHCSRTAEGCPLTLLSAMAMGKPCVVTDVAGNAEIVSSPEQAELVAPGAPDALAQAVLRLASNPARARAAGEAARARILERYSLQSYARLSREALECFARGARPG